MSDHSILAHISEKLAGLSELPHRWVVAYSGGVDSCVLLHSLHAFNQALTTPLPIVALHINHQISGNADAWQAHGQVVAQSLEVDYIAQKVTLNDGGQGVEAAAREARYQVFDEFLLLGDVLLMGHHQQDQAETVLLRLFRGAGVRGLKAMPESRILGQGHLLRPLLDRTKQELVAYAKEHRLAWVEDESNQDCHYDRNFLRQQVMPNLRTRWPALDKQLVKTAQRMEEADGLLQELAAQDLSGVDHHKARMGFSIDMAALRQLSLSRRNNVIRYWCCLHDYALPELDHLVQIEAQFLARSFPVSSACVSWSDIECRYYLGRLYLMKAQPAFYSRQQTLDWDATADLNLENAGQLRLSVNDTQGEDLVLPLQAYQVRWRQGGERCTPIGRGHSQTVKKLLQEYQLETWLRDRIPLIYHGDDLVAVGDLWVNQGYEVTPQSTAVSLRWVCD